MRRAALLAVSAMAVAGGVAVWGLARERGETPRGTAVPAVEPAETAEPRLAAAPPPSEATASEPAPPPKTDLTGTVVDSMGVPAARVRITAMTDLDPERPGRMFSDPKGIAITDEEGKFTVRGLAAGTYVLEARGDGITPTAMFATAGRGDVTLRLQSDPRAETVPLRIVDADGLPVRGALVSVYCVEIQRYVSDLTDAQGWARLALPDRIGTRRLQVKPPRDRGDLQPLNAGWHARDETVRLERAAVLRGRVVDAEGKPVARAGVYRTHGTWEQQRDALDTTNRDGAFEVRGHSAGTRLELYARPTWIPDLAANSASAEAVVGDVEPLTFTVDLGVDLTVRVEGAVESQALRAIAARDGQEEGFPHEASIGVDGLVTFRGLRKDATYAIWIPPGREDGPCAYVTGQRASGETVVVRLAPSRAVEGRLLGDGEIGEGQVFLKATGITVGDRVNEDGTFRVGGLPEGRFRLFATVWMRDGNWVGHADVGAGTRVDVSLKPTRGPR